MGDDIERRWEIAGQAMVGGRLRVGMTEQVGVLRKVGEEGQKRRWERAELEMGVDLAETEIGNG